MRFTIGSRAVTQACAFNPSTQVVIAGYNPNVFDAYENWVPLQVRRFDGQPFKTTAALRDGALELNKRRVAWSQQDHLSVLPDLCEQPVHIPQPPIDAWASGLATREQAERITATQAAYFVGGRRE